jgi:ferrochelatase
LRKLLKREGPELPVFVGMRNWKPYLADTLVEMAQAGIREALGIILAPHQGEASWGRYQAAVRQASDVAGLRMIQPAPLIRYSDPWFDHPYFVEAQADKLKCKASKIPYDRRSQAKLLFVAHSVPVSVASLYVEQLRVSCDAVAVEAGFSEWELVYQSRSGTPRDPWLEPDIGAALAKLAEEGVRDVIVVPISFVSDHVEVLFDLDREAAQLAAEKGMGYYRVCTVHDHPSFIRMLADLVRKATPGSASP